MSLFQALTATHVIETAYNYALADDPLQHPGQLLIGSGKKPADENMGYFKEEGLFWKAVFDDPTNKIGVTFSFKNMRLSEWVARVPGLNCPSPSYCATALCIPKK
jgi:hypothetical protein